MIARSMALAVVAVTFVSCSQAPAEPVPLAPKAVEGMWSDPPLTAVGTFCGGWCTDAGIDHLNALLDDPANDARPYPELAQQATRFQREFVTAHLAPEARAKGPLDPADDPSFLHCEPPGLARQMVTRHQIAIRQLDRERIELHYGEWDARRTVYLDGRPPVSEEVSRLGHSVGRWDGEALVVESSGIAAHRGLAGTVEFSDRLRVTERFERASDGTLVLTATLEDPVMLQRPLLVKKIWRWAPESEIAPYEDCERPTSVKRGTGSS